jgi:hypothetical protein
VGWIRAGFETGGGAGTAADPYNYFQNLTLDNNWFGAATVSPQNAAGAVSIVARAQAQETGHLCDGPLLQKPYSYAALADHIKRLLATFDRQSG